MLELAKAAEQAHVPKELLENEVQLQFGPMAQADLDRLHALCDHWQEAPG